MLVLKMTLTPGVNGAIETKRVFHDLSSIQGCQYCQLRFAIPFNLKVTNLERLSSFTNGHLISHLLTSYDSNNEGNCEIYI